LESQGYTTQTLVLPACALDAPHRRDRVWILATHPDSQRGCSRDTTRQDAAHARQPPCNSRAGEWNPEPDLCRVAHGIPHRVDRLRGLGNAIVPQLAYQILTAIPTPTPCLS
jgi:DNA (cytosine-5)-methyltransferase 1